MSKIVNFLDKISSEVELDITDFAEWMKGKTPELIAALNQGYKITSTFINAANSPKGIVIESLIASVIPSSKAWTPAVIELATEMGNCMTLVSGKLPAIEGIAVAYCGRIVIAMQNDITILDEAILEVQKMFVSFSTK